MPLMPSAGTAPAAADQARPAEPELAATIRALVIYAERCELIGPEDRIWAHNAVLEAIGATGPAPDAGFALGAADAGSAAPDCAAAPKAAPRTDAAGRAQAGADAPRGAGCAQAGAGAPTAPAARAAQRASTSSFSRQ